MIPKRIYQTWKTKLLPSGISHVIKKMMEINPTYTHYLYDDADMDAFVHDNFPGEISNAYDLLNIGAARADLWRYLILYKYGGVYLDIDAVILKSLDNLICPDESAIITREPFEGLFNQWILIFKRGHPLLREVINQCVRNIQTRSSNNILHLTGSTVITKMINKHLTGLELNGDVWHTPDNILERMFNVDDYYYKCRFYGIDMNEYAKYHSDYYKMLYFDNMQWEDEQKVKCIFKDGVKNPNEEIDKEEL